MLVRSSGDFAAADSIDDFTGATLAAQIGTVQNDLIADYADDAGEEGDLYVPGLIAGTAYETYPDALLALLEANSGIDGVLAERPIGEAMLAQYPTQLTMVEFYSAPEVYDDNFVITVSIALNKNNPTLLTSMNGVSAALDVSTRISWMEAAIAADKD